MYVNPIDSTTDAALAALGLPELAYVTNQDKTPGAAPVLAIARGESGYYPVHSQLSADELNAAAGVTPAQRAAMHAGSMFGWHVKGARPDVYDGEGRLIALFNLIETTPCLSHLFFSTNTKLRRSIPPCAS